MGKRRSTVATRFWTEMRSCSVKTRFIRRKLHQLLPLKSMNLTLCPSFWMIRANFRAARLASCSFLAPVHTSLPDLKMSDVHRGSRIRITTPWNLCGLYSEFLVLKLIVWRFNSHPRDTLATQFWILMEFMASCGPVGTTCEDCGWATGS